MDGIEIRAAHDRDLDAIARLEAVCFPAPWRREFFESELHQSGRLCLVAAAEGRLVGYVFAMTVVDEMHINKIAVDQVHRRRGVAVALMDRCFEAARRRAVTVMSLEVRESNRGAQEFYSRLGFERSYLRPRYYPDGESAVVMTRRV